MKGHGTAEHIGAISLACNMTGALIRRTERRQGIGEEATEIVERCQTALLNADHRFTTSWPLGFQADRNCNTFATCSRNTEMVSNAWRQCLQVRRALRDIDDRIGVARVLQRIAA